MKITELSLKNFRNYAEETFEFGDGINILTGANAQGKTNAAEALFFLCTGYSPRANRDKLVIKNGEASAEVTGSAQSEYGRVSVKMQFFAYFNNTTKIQQQRPALSFWRWRSRRG